MNAIIRVQRDAQHVRGLPGGRLPAGETLLWQGAPEWRSFARRVLHVRGLVIYFALLAAVCIGRAATAEDSLRLWWSLAFLLAGGAIAIGLLAAFAVMVARTTTYTLTDRRIVFRIGVALGMAINLPFAMIDSADCRLYRDGTGDIPLLLSGPTRLGWTTLWPHVRPWRTRRVEPMLRSIPDAALVARMLADGLARSAGAAAS